MATWWHGNAKFLLSKKPNCSAIQFICSAHHLQLGPHTWNTFGTPPPPFYPQLKKKIKPFINTGNPVPLSQTHYDDHWHRNIPSAHAPSPPPHIFNEPFCSKSFLIPSKIHTVDILPLLYYTLNIYNSLSWNAPLPQTSSQLRSGKATMVPEVFFSFKANQKTKISTAWRSDRPANHIYFCLFKCYTC